MLTLVEEILREIRCPRCQSSLAAKHNPPLKNSVALTTDDENTPQCDQCPETFPVVNGIPRILLSPLREALLGDGKATGTDACQVATARSFGFEWIQFSEMHENRYMPAEVEAWLRHSGLVDVRPNYGWVGFGRKPTTQSTGAFAAQSALSVNASKARVI